jgi:hypothetical protein
MRSSPSRVTASTGYFVIADISGYTRFVTENDLEHAQGVLHDLITLLIDRLGAPLEFVELEGDAVFVYARDEAVVNAERLLDLMEACYAAFRMRVEQMVRNTTCPCSACRAIPSLDLKCVAHHGRFAAQATPKGMQLIGPDVTLVHRLLKNRVVEATGIQAYALLTEAFVQQAFPPAEAFAGEVRSVSKRAVDPAVTDGSGSPKFKPDDGGKAVNPGVAKLVDPAVLAGASVHWEEVESFGSVRTRVIDLAAGVERHRARFRGNLDALPIDLEIVTPLPVPASFVWGYITDPALRLRWQTDIRGVRSVPADNGRTDIGASSHCDHGGYVMAHRIVDWQPFARITKHSQSTGPSITKPPPCQVDFIFEDRSDGTCVLRFVVRLRDVGMFTRLLFKAVKPLVRREWVGHFTLLQKVVAEDHARQAALAKAAVDSPGLLATNPAASPAAPAAPAA